EDLKAVQAEQRRPKRTTVLTHLGPPLAGRHTSASYARSQVCPEAVSTSPSAAPWPTFHGEEPLYQVSRARRCADRRFPRSLASVRGEGMRSRPAGARAVLRRMLWPRLPLLRCR